MDQVRDQADIYRDKISIEQSKYIALHVGIFWGIGRFILKNGDTIRIKIDSPTMLAQLLSNTTNPDPFIESKINFIKQLISQRKLDVRYDLIDPKQNMASKLLRP